MITSKKGHTCVVGLGWGDEGKGKVVDLLCAEHDVVVRYNGGANAGHTVRIGEKSFALHLLPSGILQGGKRSVIGPGVVVDPATLLEEIDGLAARGIVVGDTLFISDRAHVVMPYHQLEDRLSESAASEDGRIGTTARGIGPCYADKMRRTTAVRICDLYQPERFRARIGEIVRQKQTVFDALYQNVPRLDAGAISNGLLQAGDRIRAYVCDTTQLLQARMAAGDRILFEGANGVLLDVDHGTYPFVTSSGTTANSLGPGAGVPVGMVANVVGVTKAYATRVGRGPFVTELKDETGDAIRKAGHEFGTTTGRPRRCGWFDAVAIRYSARLSGATEVAFMHLDTLSGFRRIGLCTAYRLDGRSTDVLPADAESLEHTEPVIEWHDGWDDDLATIDRFEKLPVNARRYIERIEQLVETPVTIMGVGPERRQVILRHPSSAGSTTP